ncbi:hypothetical protein MP228_013054 [Amoeboaphelidium protococcarum]|nr:hypothetical protein MP228_013054 [Amoeboaphelidium protococcarum]
MLILGEFDELKGPSCLHNQNVENGVDHSELIYEALTVDPCALSDDTLAEDSFQIRSMVYIQEMNSQAIPNCLIHKFYFDLYDVQARGVTRRLCLIMDYNLDEDVVTNAIRRLQHASIENFCGDIAQLQKRIYSDQLDIQYLLDIGQILRNYLLGSGVPESAKSHRVLQNFPRDVNEPLQSIQELVGHKNYHSFMSDVAETCKQYSVKDSLKMVNISHVSSLLFSLIQRSSIKLIYNQSNEELVYKLADFLHNIYTLLTGSQLTQNTIVLMSDTQNLSTEPFAASFELKSDNYQGKMYCGCILQELLQKIFMVGSQESGVSYKYMKAVIKDVKLSMEMLRCGSSDARSLDVDWIFNMVTQQDKQLSDEQQHRLRSHTHNGDVEQVYNPHDASWKKLMCGKQRRRSNAWNDASDGLDPSQQAMSSSMFELSTYTLPTKKSQRYSSMALLPTSSSLLSTSTSPTTNDERGDAQFGRKSTSSLALSHLPSNSSDSHSIHGTFITPLTKTSQGDGSSRVQQSFHTNSNVLQKDTKRWANISNGWFKKNQSQQSSQTLRSSECQPSGFQFQSIALYQVDKNGSLHPQDQLILDAMLKSGT